MNPQEAKTKIENLLQLGTLKGVKVEYEYKFLDDAIFFTVPDNSRILKIYVTNESDKYTQTYKPTEDNYEYIKSITPIPLEPKLLEVGTRVKVIGVVQEDKKHYARVHEIISVDHAEYHLDCRDFGHSCKVPIWQVIPESLLVEEEEKECHCSSGYCCNNCLSKTARPMIQFLEQAGYKVTKEV